MISHVWSVLCRTANIDDATNNISLQEVVEQINLIGDGKKLPGNASVDIEIVSLYSRTDLDKPAKGEARWSMESPSGKMVSTKERIEIDLTHYRRLRSRTKIRLLPIDMPGLYWFVGELRQDGDEWERVARIPLEVAGPKAVAD